MKNKFRHFVLTPFNTPVVSSKIDRLSHDWIEYRYDILQKVTMPSLASQTNLNFQWIIMLDPRTPGKWHQTFTHELHRYLPCFASSQRIWPEIVASLTSERFIITTRLDSDDALAHDAIERIQNKFNSQTYLFVNFLNGIITDGKTKLFRVKKPSNPFISLIEEYRRTVDKSYLTTVRCMRHKDAGKQKKHFLQVDEPDPFYLIYVHGTNLGNFLPDGDNYAPKSVLDKFDIKLPIKGA